MSRTRVHKPVWAASGYKTKKADKEAFVESPKGAVLYDPVKIPFHRIHAYFPREEYYGVESDGVKGAVRTAERAARAKMMTSVPDILDDDFDDNDYLDAVGEYRGYGWWD